MTSGGTTTLTITLGNPNAFPISLTSPFVDDLTGSGMSIPNVSQYDTNCPVQPVITSTSITYPATGWIPAEGCVINVKVTATTTGTNLIAASALQTDAGTNANQASATLTIVPPLTPPGLSKSFETSPVAPGGEATLKVTLTNTNSTPLVLSNDLTDLMPTGLTLAADPTVSPTYALRYGTCDSNYVMASSGTSTAGAQLLYTAGGSIPANGSCYVAVKVVAALPSSGTSYTNQIAANALQTQGGSNTQEATAVLEVALPDMSVDISGLPISGSIGVAYTGSFTCTNIGDATALTGTSCEISGLPDGVTVGSCTLTPGPTGWVAGDQVPVNGVVTCPVSGTPTTAGSVNVTATTGATNDADSSNNTDSQSVTIVDPTILAPDMAVNIDHIPAIATAGSSYSGSYTCSNIGNADAASGTSCAITGLPAGVTVGACTLTPGSTTWSAGNAVPAGSVVTCPVSGTPTTAGSVTVTATTGATGDTNVGNNSASKSVDVGRIADLVVLKNAPVVTSPSGDLTFTVTVSNAGPSNANGTVFTDNVPAGMDPDDFSWTCDLQTGGAICPNASGTGAVNQTIATFPAGSSLTYTLTGKAPTSGSVVNTASLVLPTGLVDPDPSNNSDQTTTAVNQTALPATADLSVTKYGPTSVAPNSLLTFKLVVANAGYIAADGARLADAVPVGLTNVTWTCQGEVGGAVCPNVSGSNAIDETIAIFPAGSSLTYLVTGSVGLSGQITNQASLTPPVGVVDPDPANNNDSSLTTIEPITGIADLSVTKTGPASVANGDDVEYRLLVANAGTSPVVGALVVDQLPSGLTDVVWTCAPAIGSTGAVCQDTFGTGDVNARVDLPVGSRVEIQVTGKAPATGTAAFANVAEVFAPAGIADPDPDNNLSSAVITQLVFAPLPADLVVLKNAPALVSPSGDLTYTVTISNAGASAANGALFTDNVPVGVTGFAWTCNLETGGAICPNTSGTGAVSETIKVFPAGSSLTYTLTGQAPASGTVANTATLAAPDGVVDPDPSNNSDTTYTALSEAPLPATADLSVTKYGPTSVAPDSAVTFKLVVANAGYVAADGARLTDAVPVGLTNVTWTCQGQVGGAICPQASGTGAIDDTIDTFPAGSSLTYLVTGSVGLSGEITNQASLTPPAGVVDPDPTNNNDSSLTTVELITGIADLSVTKTGPASVSNGQTVQYRLLVGNAGTSPVTGAQVVDRLPAGLTGVTWTCTEAEGSTGGACQTPSGTGSVDVLVNLAVSSRVEIVVTGKAPATGTAAFANVAEVFAPAGIEDPKPENNLSSAVITQLLIQPVANDDYFTTLVNTPVSGQLADNDSVPTGSTFGLVTAPTYGSVNIDPVTGEFTYTPQTGWTGVDTFTYQICLPAPNQTVCDNAIVTVSIPNVAAANNGSTTTSGNPNLLNVLDNVTFNGQPIPPSQALIEQMGTWPNGLSLNEQTGQVGVAPGTPPGNYQVQVMVCKKPPNVGAAVARSVANLTVEGQCAMVTLDIVVTAPPLPAPIPTLGEWGRILMMLMMILSVSYYGRRTQRR